MAVQQNTKIELEDFKRQMEETYGEENCNFESVKRVAMVTFRRTKKGNISGLYDGKTIYEDKESESIISEGDTWFCELKQNPRLSHQYFAKAIMKVDAGFLYDLRKYQIDELSRIVWENNRNTIEPELEKYYANRIESKAKEISESMTQDLREEISGISLRLEETLLQNSDMCAMVEEDRNIIADLTADKNALEEELKALREEKSELSTRLMEMIHECEVRDSTIEECRLTIADLTADKEVLTEKMGALIKELDMARCECNEHLAKSKDIGHRTVVSDTRCASDSVVRVSEDTLYSNMFKDGRYKVRFSSDMRTISIRADDDGEAESSNNLLRIEGLGSVTPFFEPQGFEVRMMSGRLEIRI